MRLYKLAGVNVPLEVLKAYSGEAPPVYALLNANFYAYGALIHKRGGVRSRGGAADQQDLEQIH